jgi:hypothetical protein
MTFDVEWDVAVALFSFRICSRRCCSTIGFGEALTHFEEDVCSQECSKRETTPGFGGEGDDAGIPILRGYFYQWTRCN